MLDFLVTTARGLDELLLMELKLLVPDAVFKSKPGHLLFSAELVDAYRICMHSRLANRVLLKLAEQPINNADDLYKLASSVNWTSHFSVDHDFVVDFIGTNREINNSQFGALKVKDAIVDQFSDLFDSRPSINKLAPHIRVQARLHRQQLSLFLDLSGQSLHQRHYRQRTGSAPLKEHLACAMLMRSGWYNNQDKPLLDPMCGSGTVVIEAALIAARIAPGLNRKKWGFTHWKQHDEAAWQSVLEKADSIKVKPTSDFIANDIDKGILALAKQNADSAGVFDYITFANSDATKYALNNKDSGYIVSNPPYGERLGELTELLPVFQKWGVGLKTHFKDWKMSLLTSNRDLLRQLKLLAKKEYKLMNGKLECVLVNYDLDEKNCEIKEGQSIGGDFANRLAKNLKKLARWKASQNTNCFRIYDADLPEYNVAIDQYADWIVVQEYAAPKDIPEHKTRRRLHEVLVSIPQVTGVASANIVLKTRSVQKGTNQYQKVADKNSKIQVFENGAKLLVNLQDYLDTGLFLDHRITRQKVQNLSKQKDVLNLFAYTGSVSVHAALGNARSVTTVDMSKTYIDWARENFQLNGLKGAYEFIQADCLSWLASHHKRYDLIFVDPPSFSNSKRMEDTWDVQRDHVKLLVDVKKCLNAGGKIIFSNNLRQFKLDVAAIKDIGLTIENISNQTLPEDFKRNPKIHHCWMLSLND